MATTTAQRALQIAPRSEAPLGARVAVTGISGPSNSKIALLSRLAERMVESLTEVGFPALGSRHPNSVSSREKADLEKERAWASGYFVGPF